MKRYRYVIIGNSAGGIGAIEAIREADRDGTIAVIAEEEYHVYSKPLISYYLANKITYEKIFYRDRSFYEKKDVDVLLGRKAIRIDFNQNSVVLEDGDRIVFERLLLATGGEPFVPKIAGTDKYEFSTFTTLKDSIRLRDKLEHENIKRAVVLGGGLIGLKAGEGLINRGVNVTIVELADRILSTVLDRQASGMVQNVLEERGISVRTNRTLAEITGEDGRVSGVILNNGDRIDCDLVVVAVGVRPRVELAKDTPIRIGRGIIVDKHMRTSVPNVYACGDCAEVYDFIMDSFRLTPLWPTAYVGGRIAGFNMTGMEKEYIWGTGMNSVEIFGFPVISAGLINPQDDDEVLEKLDPDKRIYRKFLVRNQRIVGMILVNEIDRAGVILGLMRNKVDVETFKDKLLLKDFGQIYFPPNIGQHIWDRTRPVPILSEGEAR